MKHTTILLAATVNAAPKKGLIVLGIILAVVLILVAVIAVFASKNTKAMNKALDDAIATISEEYEVKELPATEYETMKIYGVLKFHTKQYSVKNLGNLSVMKVNMGFMQMATLILTATEKNLPLVSADYMYMFGSRKSYLEFFDLVEEKDEPYQALLTKLQAVKDNYKKFPDIEREASWMDVLETVGIYKSGKAADDETFNTMLKEGLQTVLDAAKELPLLEEPARSGKQKCNKEYTDGLISKGGISTDIFKKSLGDEVTREFFDRVLFGSATVNR